MVYRCVPADAVALMRRPVYHGVGLAANNAQDSQTLFRIDFDAFTFMGPSRKLYLSCVVCLNHCEMVGNMYIVKSVYRIYRVKGCRDGKENGRRTERKGE